MTLLKSLDIEGFRGFCHPSHFDFGAHATVIGGANGTGKTSLFDAIEWALLGNVPRLSGTRDYVKAGDVYMNVFCGVKSAPSVRLLFATDHGTVEFVRTPEKHVSRIAGRVAPLNESYRLIGIDPDDPGGCLLRAFLLEQDKIAQFVDQRPRDRYDALKSLSTLLRLESSEEMLSAVLEEAQRTVRDEIESVEASLDKNETLLSRLDDDISFLKAKSSAVAALSSEALAAEEHVIVRQVTESGVLSGQPPSQPLSALAVADAELVDRIREFETYLDRFEKDQGLRSRRSTLTDRLQEIGTALISLVEELQKLSIARDQTQRAAAEAEAQLEEIRRRHSDLNSLLAGILRHIREDACPVCRRAISAEALRDIIHTEIKRTPIVPEALEEALAARRTEITSIDEQIASASASERKLREEQKIVEIEADGLKRQLAAADDLAASIRAVMPVSLGITPEQVQQQLSEFRARLAQIRNWISELKRIEQKRSLLDQSSLLQSKMTEAASLARTLNAVKERLGRLQHGAHVLTNAREVARNAQVELTRKLLSRYTPTTAELIQRLKPHRVFTEFGIEVIAAYREGEVFLQSGTKGGLTVQIPTIFSMTQRNAVALCLFIAINLSLGVPQTFMLIDDPLHSMDDVNALALADLFRQLKGKRQLLFSTHDKGMFDLFMEKLNTSTKPESEANGVAGYWFDAWVRSGPRIRSILPPRIAPVSLDRILASIA